jgi:hypothetical protein
MKENRLNLFDHFVWYGIFLILVIATVDNLVYRLPNYLGGGYWFVLAVLLSFGSILYFLRRFFLLNQVNL